MSAAGEEVTSIMCSEHQQQQQQQQQHNDETVKTTTDEYIGTLLSGANATLGSDVIMGGGTVGGNSAHGITLMQSSPPPHSYRHSRAYRHFKNPPQPHMCIRTTTESGEELFINVLSWTRIVIPQEPSDPIPLYGGMRVPPGSPRSPPIVFAVMANPEVLKDSGRHSKDPEERRAMVELMCDFVEAMNPGVKLVRNAVILKDRDISGELKDVWNAVQAQRDREREEQMMQQRQQQHYHNITTQQMYPKSPETSPIVDQNTEDEKILSPGNEYVFQEAENEQRDDPQFVLPESEIDVLKDVEESEKLVLNTGSKIENHCGKAYDIADQTDAGAIDSEKCSSYETRSAIDNQKQTNNVKKSNSPTSPTSETTSIASVATITVAAPTKKEKLGGFLPNGCIFPRFKNNKHKDKEKESKTKDKDKTLLNALKKSKDKKVAPIEQAEKAALDSDMKAQYDKNCINLESEVQKLDLNKMDAVVNSDANMFIKLKVATSSSK